MSYTFWQGIKSMRSVAYFKQALDSGGTQDLRQKWKENPRWRDRIMLSGVICASTLVLFGRSLYRKAKSAFKKHKEKKAERKQQMLTTDFDEGKTLSKPVVTEKEVVPVDEEQINDSPQSFYHQEPDVDDIDSLFESDAIPTNRMYQLEGNLISLRVSTTKVDRPNSILITLGDSKYYLNGSGIFDNEHNSIFIAGRNETLAISKLIQHKDKSVINDFFSIFESF